MPNAVEPLVAESSHFALRIARARPEDTDAVAATLGAARATGVDLLICRIPTNALSIAQAIEAQGGRLCDTLVVLERSYSAAPSTVGTKETSVRAAREDDAAALVRIAQSAFRDYLGHWHADPRIPRTRADDFYAAWMRDICQQLTGGAHRVFVLDSAGGPAAFAAYRACAAETFDIALGGVEPQHRGRGLYRDLIAGTDALLFESDQLRRTQYSTQINNHPAIRVVSGLGYHLTRSEYTFHVWL
ncbi:MAG: hypothetical protein ABR543_07460 [Gemmatimonadaceae bacterium]